LTPLQLPCHCTYQHCI